ncbi:MAG: ABC transporter ATP-binding protein, partial [Planctomycetota bacterium]|nr:ABC transporter ATP-binding protein [Planctomycetota bacterium]
MALSQIRPLDQIFTRRDMFRGKARLSLLWSLAAGVMLVVLLLLAAMLASLFVDRGRVRISSPTDVEAAWKLSGETLFDLPDDGDFPTQFLSEDTGAFPLVWHQRATVCGAILGLFFRTLSTLHSNTFAFQTLIVLLVLAGLARVWIVNHIARLAEHEGLDAAGRLRASLHQKTLRLGPSDVADSRNQYVYSLFTDDVQKVRQALTDYLAILGRFWVELTLMILVAIGLNWRVTFECLIPVGFSCYLLFREQLNVEAVKRLNADRADHEMRILAESLRKTRLVRAYGMEDFEHQQFGVHLARFRASLEGKTHHKGAWNWDLRAGAILGAGSALFLMGKKILLDPTSSAWLPAPSAIAIVAAFTCCVSPIRRFMRSQQNLADSGEAAGRIQRYLAQIPEVGQAVGAKFLQPLTKSLHFESVTYRLPNKKPLVDSLDLKIKAGEMVAIVSLDPLESRGLTYLLPRFIEPQAGRVLFDGEDIAWVTLDSLRAESVYVGGADPFFTGTVLENITCGNSDYSTQQITEAAKQAHAHHFILKLPEGYDTVLGEHGERLDPGEAFRLGLARAVLRNPALLVVEEPDVPLDNDTKSLLDDAYQRIFTGRTIVFLPSRLSTLRRVDQIVVLHRGRVAVIGKHANLVKTSEVYR